MATIQVQIQDDLVQRFGVEAIKRMIDDELAYQRFRLLEEGVQAALQQAEGVNWDKEFEEARQKAFDEYRKKREPNA
ncbi:hypothetical protein BN8_03747 [Fibrisoma limi BUZ 3]|uniref:Uncharacterized protein n=1 Tax=Fibrisoma limi BUZ 3 TaxID=1185876 RepID=I2GKY9_9BACT|nr:hypothetical protein [Fibrisoma limi]CCH54565.1 hypothetical protein BN8_03747 [Fibrisoma limi BUZ 3]